MSENKKEKIVFTNGCFDILHPGHLDLLQQARALGTKLIVGLNSDRSVKNLKGEQRPILDQDSRREMLLALKCVDEVKIFDENTPEKLVREVSPDVLVKGGDWNLNEIVGAKFVMDRGGEVYSIPFKRQLSTTQILENITVTNPEKKEDSNEAGKAELPASIEDIVTKNLEERRNLYAENKENIIQIVKVLIEAKKESFLTGIWFQETDEDIFRKLNQHITNLEVIIEDKGLVQSKIWDAIFLFNNIESATYSTELAQKLMLFRNHSKKVVLIGNNLDKKLRSLADVFIDTNFNSLKIVNELVDILINVLDEFTNVKSDIK